MTEATTTTGTETTTPAADSTTTTVVETADPAAGATTDPVAAPAAPAADPAKTEADPAAKPAADAPVLKTPEAFAEEQAAQLTTMRQGWMAEAQADPEFGGDKLAENLAHAKAAMEATATPKLMELLARSGLGDHPEMIRHFLKVAPAFTPDRFVPAGSPPTKGEVSAAKVLYPTSA